MKTGFTYTKGNRAKIALSVAVAFLGVLCGMVPYVCAAAILNQLLAGSRDFATLAGFVAVAVAAYVLSVLGNTFSTILSHNIAFSVMERVRLQLLDKMTRLPMGAIRSRGSGSWSQLIGETMEKLEKPIAHIIPEVTSNILASLLMICFVFLLDWRLGLANLATIPLGLLFYCLMMRNYEKESQQHMDASKTMNATIAEYVNGIEVIKAFNRAASSYGKYKNAVEDNKRSVLEWFACTGKAMTTTMELLPSTLLFVLPIGLYLFMQGSILPGTLLLCVLLAISTMKPLIKAMEYVATIADLRVVFGEIGGVLAQPELVRPDEPKVVSGAEVVFQDVSFRYDKDEVLKQVNLRCREGELTAIVGPSGSGKSTLASLLAGFWSPTQGTISIGGVGLQQMPLAQSMQLVTYVSQDNFLFNQSILENIRMGKESASLDEVMAVCKKAGCHTFISALPQGYDTLVGEAGGNLSGGERQRVTIARAMLKNSPILLLDEATSYADPENETVVQASISELARDKTVITIAHRLSTIIHANKIYVMENGRVAASGTHAELLQSCALYQTMWKNHIEAKDTSLEVAPC